MLKFFLPPQTPQAAHEFWAAQSFRPATLHQNQDASRTQAYRPKKSEKVNKYQNGKRNGRSQTSRRRNRDDAAPLPKVKSHRAHADERSVAQLPGYVADESDLDSDQGSFGPTDGGVGSIGSGGGKLFQQTSQPLSPGLFPSSTSSSRLPFSREHPVNHAATKLRGRTESTFKAPAKYSQLDPGSDVGFAVDTAARINSKRRRVASKSYKAIPAPPVKVPDYNIEDLFSSELSSDDSSGEEGDKFSKGHPSLNAQ